MILADEPTGALDTRTATIVMEIFKIFKAKIIQSYSLPMI